MMRHALVGLLICTAVSGCSLEDQAPPSISGPSEFALSLVTTQSASTISRDGSSQATITVIARNSTGAPAANQRFLLSLNGPTGTQISASEITTDAAGRATVSVVAPASSSTGDQITVGFRPIDDDGNRLQDDRFVSVALTPSNTTAPTAAFTVSPTAPSVGDLVTFNASSTTDNGVACDTACTYAWTFSDGSTATGMVATRTFTSGGGRNVTLTVTDAGGASGSVTQTVTVALPTAPAVGTITFGPTPVRPNAGVNFDAGGATVGAGASLVDYTWVFGDGDSTVTTSPQVQHTYSAVGVYTVRVTVRDTLGRTATGTVAVTVSTTASNP
jgi:PKD repeat protein